MSHFYGETKGARGEATRCGHKSSGIRSRAASWDLGGTIRLWWDKDKEEDEMTVILDDGNSGSRCLTFAIRRTDLDTILDHKNPVYALGSYLMKRSKR